VSDRLPSNSSTEGAAPLWRVPQQARSRQRFNDILDAAAELFVESGYDRITADTIAARANTSVGGLYRFFPDKLAIFQALLDRYFQQLRDLSAALHTEAVTQLPLADYIELLVDGFDRFVSENPGFKTAFVQSRLIAATDRIATEFYREFAGQLIVYLTARNPDLDPAQRELIARIFIEVAWTLDLLALSSDLNFQKRVLVESKKLLLAYLQPYCPDPSV
jgi:AcrR family transcriptional regulator